MGMKTKAPTLRQFQARFPTEDACLDHLMRTRFGARHACEKCGKDAKFYRVKARRSYACEWCGYQVYPTAGTPFDRTRTSLRDWFQVMFLFTTTRNGVAAKEVERQIGVTYKTAWRMCHEIRKYMMLVDGDEPMGGPDKHVEIDEAFLGGKVSRKVVNPLANKDTVFGMMERGGDIVTVVVPDRRENTLTPIIRQFVKQDTTVHTDDWGSYRNLGLEGYDHQRVNHSGGEYVSKSGASVNGIESFWAQLKRGINGTHIHVSQKHLPKYLAEFEFRYNRRHRPFSMMDELLCAFQR
jgi:transposase